MGTSTRHQPIKRSSADQTPARLASAGAHRADASRSLQPAEQRISSAHESSAAGRLAYDFSRVPIYAHAPVGLQAKLAVNQPGDACEQEADRIADQVAAASEHAPASREASAQAKPIAGGVTSAAPPLAAALRSSGQPLDAATRTDMEARFGHDFSRVRVHTGRQAAAAAQVLQARAFTSGSDMFFRPGEFMPQTGEGRRLLAHELTHTLQQGRSAPTIQRAPDDKAAAADPLCATFDFDVTRVLVHSQTVAYQATKKIDQRLPLIRSLKLIRRCATPEQQAEVKSDMEMVLGATDTGAVWAEAGTAFGGYTGMYPEYAGDIKGQLTQLGTSETLPFGKFELSGSGAKHRSRAKKTAAGELGDLARTDIVYFRGHQFAQYRAPGVFSDGSETFGFDLRYIEKAGGFPNVKLMISTSCATLCKEAFEVFHGLFPNAVILGYRKSAPLEGGKVRDTFRSKVKALSRPLLLEESVDITAIIGAWKSTIESRHAGDTAQLPGYYQNGTIHYWDGAAWKTIGPLEADNVCKRKGDFRDQYPAPAPSGSSGSTS
ncbi:MAG TPA: DUF4157 domain-containing protein [Herpetosiphonaceae bacterium]